MSQDSDLFNHFLNQPQSSMFGILEYLHDNNTNQPTNDITEPSLFSPEENEHDMDNTYNNCFSNFQNSQNNISLSYIKSLQKQLNITIKF